MLSRLGIWYTVVDSSADIYTFTSKLLGNIPPTETFVLGDWLHFQLPPQDLILADGSLNMLPHSLHARMMASIAQHLKPGGITLMHVHLQTPTPFQSVESLIRWYRDGPGKDGCNIFTAITAHLHNMWHTDLVATQGRYNEELLKEYKRGTITGVEFAQFVRRNTNTTLYLTTHERLRQLAQDNGLVLMPKVCIADDWPAGSLKPIFVLRKLIQKRTRGIDAAHLSICRHRLASHID